MQFNFRDYDFEIDDVWLDEAGCRNFINTRAEKGFLSHGSATLIHIANVLTPKRDEGVRLFDPVRMVKILKEICDQDIIHPIKVCVIEDEESEFTHRVKDGFHRFYASVAMGFEVIPATIVEVESEDAPDPLGPRKLDWPK